MPGENLYQPPDTNKVFIQSLQDDDYRKKEIAVDVLRLDGIHPVISGNKWFKLRYYLQQAAQEKYKGIVTFGGAWSNHLVATALACKQAGIACVGVVRGEPSSLYASLQDAAGYGMQLHFVTRTDYNRLLSDATELLRLYPGFLLIPQGGQSATGVRGAEEILSLANYSPYTHILAAVGTGTMLTGLLAACLPSQQVIGISSLKIKPQDNDIETFIRQHSNNNNFVIHYQYHFGGYARHTPELLHFMNALYRQQQLPADVVYTGKLFYAIDDLIRQQYFPKGSRLLAIHSGGLQGNRSLPQDTLTF